MICTRLTLTVNWINSFMPISDDLLARAKRYPKQKELGQNFLVDSAKLDAIVSASGLDPKRDVVIEIGPGIGFLTERLVNQVYRLFAVELDANAITSLNILKANHKNFDFIRGDFLSLSIAQILGTCPELIAEIQSGSRPSSRSSLIFLTRYPLESFCIFLVRWGAIILTGIWSGRLIFLSKKSLPRGFALSRVLRLTGQLLF